MNAYARILVVLAALVLAGPVAAAERALGAEWKPIDTARLDGMRGGFVVPSGFVVSFGIERVVSINGEVVTATRLRIPDIARITADQAQLLASLRDSQVVQVGAGTLVAGDTRGLVIQNAVDGQTISARTSLDVGLNTLQLHRDSLFDASITRAVIAGLPTL